MDAAISVITVGELKKSIHCITGKQKRNRLEIWFAEQMLPQFKNRTLTIDSDTMIVWGEMIANLQQRGITLPIMDSLLAAQCKQHNLCIITRNTKDFEKAGIEINNPWLDEK